jgi:dTDP-4-dehydrorhamnose reductase
MKILLLGKNGMLGSQFAQRLAGFPGVELAATDKDDLDVLSFGALKRTFEFHLPDFVINCTGYTDVDKAEFKKKDAMKLNADTLKSIAKLCNKHGSRLIHFSTDYVFDGRKTPPDGYSESDIANPLSTYGDTKLRGEEFIKKEMVKYYIVRTSWLYGPRPAGTGGGNFVDTMLRLGKEVLSGDRPELNVVSDQFGAPTHAPDLAETVIDNFIMKWPDHLPDYGVFHLTNDDYCSWHEFALRIFELREMAVKVGKIGTSDYRTAAQRPANSILLNTKLPKMRRWDEALADYLG